MPWSPSMVTNSESLPSEVSALDCERHRRVLVVDDNAVLAKLTSVLLVHRGFDVATASDGHVAIAMARSFRPHVILLDIGLPGMEGYQVGEVLRADAETRDAIIIAVSAYSRDVHPGRSGKAGFDHHLVKPVDSDALQLLFNPGSPLPARRNVRLIPAPWASSRLLRNGRQDF
jgi:CheY-like chemotaxis protein